MIDTVLNIFKSSFNFKGRSTRSELWMFFAFEIFTAIIAICLCMSVATLLDLSDKVSGGIMLSVGILWLIGTFVPKIALSVRRLHDGGHSGWLVVVQYVFMPLYYLFVENVTALGLIAVLNCTVSVIYLVFLFIGYQRGNNKYGIDPRFRDDAQYVVSALMENQDIANNLQAILKKTPK